MAKTKDKKLYDKLRANGVRKRVARDLTALPSEVKGGKRAPKPLREAVDRLDETVTEMRGHLRASDRKGAAKKAARTRRTKASKRSASARKGARSRARS